MTSTQIDPPLLAARRAHRPLPPHAANDPIADLFAARQRPRVGMILGLLMVFAVVLTLSLIVAIEVRA